jgi:membrane-associated phospholipid phosphatase
MTIECLNLGALIAMMLASAAARRLTPTCVALEVWFGLLIGLTMLSGRRASRRGVCFALAVAAVVVVSVYASLGAVIATLGPPPRDRLVLAVEALLTRGRWPPLSPLPLPAWAIDGFSVAYVLYFVLPAVVIVALVRREQLVDARAAMFTLLVAFYLHYAIYLVVPVVGPLRTPELTAAVQTRIVAQGGWITNAVRFGVGGLEGATPDAFPSAHTSIALLVAVMAVRHRVRGRWLVCLTAAAIASSTIVLGYHYLVDVIAAMPVAGLAWRLSRGQLDLAFTAHLKSPPWRSSITSTSA